MLPSLGEAGITLVAFRCVPMRQRRLLALWWPLGEDVFVFCFSITFPMLEVELFGLQAYRVSLFHLYLHGFD